MAQRAELTTSTSWADETDDVEEPVPTTKTKENAWAKGNPWGITVSKPNEASSGDSNFNDFPAPKAFGEKEPKREDKPHYDDARGYGGSGRQGRERNDYPPRGEQQRTGGDYSREHRGGGGDYSREHRGGGGGEYPRVSRSGGGDFQRGDYRSGGDFQRGGDFQSNYRRDGGRSEGEGSGERYNERESGGFGRREEGRYRAERPPRDPVPFPTEPPFTAFIGNLPFDVKEDDLYHFFEETQSKVLNVRLPMNPANKPKGFGYVEFGDLESLKNAVARNGEPLLERPLRIDVAEAKPQGEPARKSFGFRSREEGPRDFRSSEPPAPFNREPRAQEPVGERPKLELKPRSTDAPKVDQNVYEKAKSNPFGEARPRDESLFLKKIEEERKKKTETSPPPQGESSPTAEQPPAQPTETRSTNNQEEGKNFQTKRDDRGPKRNPRGNDRGDRADRGDRNDRPDRADRNDRADRGDRSNDTKPPSDKPFVRGSKPQNFRKGDENKGKPRREERRGEERREERAARPLPQEVKPVVDVTNANPFSALPDEEDI